MGIGTNKTSPIDRKVEKHVCSSTDIAYVGDGLSPMQTTMYYYALHYSLLAPSGLLLPTLDDIGLLPSTQ